MKIFDGALRDLEHALDVRAHKHGVLQGNLANIDTPGFVPQDVDFDAAMAGASGGDDDDDDGAIGAAERSTASLDGNRVDADRTMASLAENALQYGAATRVAAKKLALLRYVANDGTAG